MYYILVISILLGLFITYSLWPRYHALLSCLRKRVNRTLWYSRELWVGPNDLTLIQKAECIIAIILNRIDDSIFPQNTRIHTLPGMRLRGISELVFSPKVMQDVIEPVLADLQHEYMEAVAQHRGRAKFFFIRLRGYWSFFSAAGLQAVVSLGKRIVEIYKAAR